MGKQDMTAWMPADDMKIMELHTSLGPRWSTIATHFPGRTVSSIRNRYLRLHAGEKLRESGTITKNRCQLCGMPKRGHICQVKLAVQRGAPAEVPVMPAVPIAAPSPVKEEAMQPPPMQPHELELPVAAATVAVSHPMLPQYAIPAHLLEYVPIKQLIPVSGLPTCSPVLPYHSPFAYHASTTKFTPEDVQAEAAATAQQEMLHKSAMGEAGSATTTQPASPGLLPTAPMTLMVDLAHASDELDGGEQPSTPAAA